MHETEIAFMRNAGGWAWRCRPRDRNNLGYGDDRDKAAKDAADHERRTHARPDQHDGEGK